MKKISQKISLTGVAILMTIGLSLLPVGGVLANPACGVSGGNDVCQTGPDLQVVAKNVLNILFMLIGSLSVIVIIVGGIMYITSGGDQGKVTTAKSAITGAVIGVVIAIMAYAIVNYVLSQFWLFDK